MVVSTCWFNQVSIGGVVGDGDDMCGVSEFCYHGSSGTGRGVDGKHARSLEELLALDPLAIDYLRVTPGNRSLHRVVWTHNPQSAILLNSGTFPSCTQFGSVLCPTPFVHTLHAGRASIRYITLRTTRISSTQWTPLTT